MSMRDLIRKIEQHGKGVQAYTESMQLARKRLETPSDLAAAYFMLRYAADKFVHAYDDQPLLSTHAEEEFKHFKNYIEQLSELETTSDASTKLDILNRVAAEIANHNIPRSKM